MLIDIEMPDQDWLSSIDRGNVSHSAVIFLYESKVRTDLSIGPGFRSPFEENRC